MAYLNTKRIHYNIFQTYCPLSNSLLSRNFGSEDREIELGVPSKKKTWIFGDNVQKGGREVRLNHIYNFETNCDTKWREGVM